ncbi:hypothetical protein L228DRAFT_242991 [Xylona heveae TC161]|uniref:NADH-ubiquinone oxidoreductase 213 kDa subunit n=1 Tax=Xylona heveae (strain CBS 132557 / TC161) TaxID=1328760 RepID=A0A165JQL1_XYLHT|nr:hypothetical protein L228DRAFT_242991 [Xylona heveae TC161]KZF26517.1 hypothetical protein L228DRAFT_242991 [Xylona heveae TC161]
MERSHGAQPALQDGIIFPALQFGTLAGVAGLGVGGIAGLVRSQTPTLFAFASSTQWFTLGTAYWGVRGIILHMRGAQSVSPRERIYASGIAGGLAGAGVALITRGRSNVIPGAIMCSLLGSTGQGLYNVMDAQHAQSYGENERHASSPFWQRLAQAKWSPVRVLSDKEYEKMLRERLLRVEAEIAIIDEEIKRNTKD